MNPKTRLILQDCRTRNDIPADFMVYMADELQYLGDETPSFDLHLCTCELIAALIYAKPRTRILAASYRALFTLNEIQAEVGSWDKDWPLMPHEKSWLSYLKLA